MRTFSKNPLYPLAAVGEGGGGGGSSAADALRTSSSIESKAYTAAYFALKAAGIRLAAVTRHEALTALGTPQRPVALRIVSISQTASLSCWS